MAFTETTTTEKTRLPIRGKTWTRPASDYFYYFLLLVAVGAFLYYLYSYGNLALIYLPTLLQGTLNTVIISILSALLAVVIGFIGAMGRLSRLAPIRYITMAYVEVVRGTPLLVQLLLWYFGVNALLSNIGINPHDIAFDFMTILQNNSLITREFNGFFYGIVGLSFNYGAYLTEVFRAGILSVDKGQKEAAISLGLDDKQTMRHIILPQALRTTIPPFTNTFINLIQDSSYLIVLAVVELEYVTNGLALPQPNLDRKMFVFVLGALLYLALCYPLSLLARYLERRLNVAHIDV